MLTMRESQMATFEQAVIHNFEGRLFKHLEEFFPKHCQILGEEQVRKVIRYGIARAEEYGIISERDVHLYMGLMFMLGSNFDRDPQLPWAAQILNDATITAPSKRADRLYGKAMNYLNQVAGRNHEHLERALRKVQALPVTALERSAEEKQRKESFGQHLMSLLYTLFPEKYEAVGEEILHPLARQSYEAAKQYNVSSERGVATITGLMFILGSGFASDPQYPWAEKVLNNASIKDPVKKSDLLHQEAMNHLQQWLA